MESTPSTKLPLLLPPSKYLLQDKPSCKARVSERRCFEATRESVTKKVLQEEEGSSSLKQDPYLAHTEGLSSGLRPRKETAKLFLSPPTSTVTTTTITSSSITITITTTIT
uniref:Uncharacterized protein n=1 Tax=Vespula pensylvanica TaxID=30213 RepID=A0A834UFN8_VESPE|nr:hypothetical protein H0235_004038 [Vespula pensylvanica]